jgi:OOP family OmpA-OmpF porin
MPFTTRHKRLGVLALLLCTVSLPAAAHSDANWESSLRASDAEYWAGLPDRWFYVGADGGWARHQDACDPVNESCQTDAGAFEGLVGYQWGKYLAFEAGYMYLGQIDADYLVNGNVETYSGTMHGLDLTPKFSFPITRRLDLFGKAGAFWWQGKVEGPGNTDKSQGWAWSAGVGADFKLTRRFSLRGEYRYLGQLGDSKLGETDVILTTFGVLYRFGQTRTRPPTMHISAMLETVPFEFGVSTPQTTDPIDPVLVHMQAYPEAFVRIVGMTDVSGPQQFNLGLSEKRAQAVADYLMRGGIASGRISVEAMGVRHPVIDNLTREKRAQNRRVLLLVAPFEHHVHHGDAESAP